MIDPITLLLLILATMFVARTVVEEEIFAWLRGWIVKVNKPTGKFAYLVHCKVCMSFWASLLITGLWVAATRPHPLMIAVVVFAVAEAAPRALAWNPGFKGK